MFKTADVYCSEITYFFTRMHPPLPPPSPQKKRTRKLFCTKSVSESCEKWNMKMYLKLHFNVLAQDLQPTMRINTKKKKKKKKKESMNVW